MDIVKRAYLKTLEETDVSISLLVFQQGVAKISFEVPFPGPELLKLIYMQSTGQFLTAVIESPQAEMDLVLTTVNIKTGEVVDLPKVAGHVED